MTNYGLKKSHVIWVMADTIITAGLSLGTMLILARIVRPADFGTAAIILGLTLLLNIFVEGLFHDALIQARNLNARTAGAAFMLVLTVAALLCTAIIGVELSFRDLLKTEEDWLVLSAVVSLILTGPIGVSNGLMRKDFNFALVARASVVGKLLGCTVGIVIALAGGGAFALIWQYTAGVMLQCALIVPAVCKRIRLNCDFRTLGPLLRFAMPYALMHSLVEARMQAFTILIAGYLGLTIAGYINVAFRLTTTAQGILAAAFSNLTFPLLAKFQNSQPDLLTAFQASTKLIAGAALPAFIGLSLVAPDFVPVALGPGWEATVPLVTLIAASSSLAFMRLSSSFLLRATGHIRYSFWNAVFQLTITTGGLALVRPIEPMDALLLWVLPMAIQPPLTWAVVRSVTQIGVGQQLVPLLPSLVATAVMAGVIFALSPAVAGLTTAIRLTVKIVTGAIVYGACFMALDREARSVLVRVLLRR